MPERPGPPPVCHIVAGPNGAGKSTFALRYLPRYAGTIEFVNPDLFAQGASPLDLRLSALEAAKRSLRRIRALAAAGLPFGFESTLAGRSYLPLVGDCARAGFRVHLYYLWTSSPAPLPGRIAHRVRTGGHDVPHADVLRRYRRSLANLRAYMALADRTYVFDAEPPVPELVLQRNGSDAFLDPARARRFLEELPQ